MDELKMLMLLKRASGGKPLVEYTATGNPVTFETNVAKAFRQSLVGFSPYQSGTGDPSPENIRPISGTDHVNVFHSGEDTSDPTTYTIVFPQTPGTVYKGSIDPTTGVLTVDWAFIEFNGTEYWRVHGSIASWFYVDGALTNPYVNNDENSFAISNKYKQSMYKAGSGITNGRFMIGAPAGSSNRLVVKDTDVSTADDFKASLQSTPMQLCYKIDTPLTYQLTAQQINTLIGTNVLLADTNGDVTVKYLKKG